MVLMSLVLLPLYKKGDRNNPVSLLGSLGEVTDYIRNEIDN